MGTKQLFTAAILPFICASFLSAQSLTEAAKKEKERRANLKKKSTKVVTNADLKKRKNSPAVSVPQNKAAEADKAKPRPRAAPPPKPKRSQQKRAVEKAKTSRTEILEKNYEIAKERVELLSLKMNGLWQKFNSADDMTPKERIQSEIAQTYLLLQKAQHEAAKAKGELDKAKSRKDS